VQFEATSEGLHLRLGDRLLFDIGKAQLKPQVIPILKKIAELVRNNQKEVYVEGHTDNVPIHTKQFPSNWELSTARAMSVVRYLHVVEGIPGNRLAAVGHGEFRPLVPNDTPAHRAKNRRVEIYITWKGKVENKFSIQN
jgi:chemotaxis protein MotB